MSTRQASGPVQIPPVKGLLRNDSVAQFELGLRIHDTLGNTYKYIKANEAVAEGEGVTAIAGAAWDSTIVTDGAISANSGQSYIHVDTVASAVAANYYAGSWIYQAAAAAKGKAFKIKSHPSLTIAGEADIELEDPINEAIADGTVLYIYNPYIMELLDADTEIVMGIGIGTISAGYYGFVQCGGFCPVVKVGHSTSAAIVLNELLRPVAAVPGAFQGTAVGSDGEAEIMQLACSPLIALEAVGANTPGYIPALFGRVV